MMISQEDDLIGGGLGLLRIKSYRKSTVIIDKLQVDDISRRRAGSQPDAS